LVSLEHWIPISSAHLPALLAHRSTQETPLARPIDELDLAPPLSGLVRVEDPDVGRDTSAVEHAGRQSHDGIDEVFLEKPLTDRRRAPVSVEQRSRVGDHRSTSALTVLPCRAEFRCAVSQEQHLPVADAREAVAEPGTGSLRLLPHGLLFDLPVDAERRIRQDVVEGLLLVEVLDEGVALLDGIRAAPLNEEVGLPERERARHELL